MDSTAEKIGVGITIVVAGLFAYATFPAFLGFFVPEIPPLWEPLVTGAQAFTAIGAVAGMGVLLAVVNQVRQARATGNPIVPVLVWVILFALIGAAITAFVAVVAFEATYQSMIELGATGSVAVMVALIVAVVAWRLLTPKLKE